MTAERRGPAGRDRAHDAALDAAEVVGVEAQIGPAVAAQDVGELDGRSCGIEGGAEHRPSYAGSVTSRIRRSSGLAVARMRWVATWEVEDRFW